MIDKMIKVYQTIRHEVDKHEVCLIGNRKISKLSGVDLFNTSKCIKNLLEQGFIVQCRGGFTKKGVPLANGFKVTDKSLGELQTIVEEDLNVDTTTVEDKKNEEDEEIVAVGQFDNEKFMALVEKDLKDDDVEYKELTEEYRQKYDLSKVSIGFGINYGNVLQLMNRYLSNLNNEVSMISFESYYNYWMFKYVALSIMEFQRLGLHERLNNEERMLYNAAKSICIEKINYRLWINISGMVARLENEEYRKKIKLGEVERVYELFEHFHTFLKGNHKTAVVNSIKWIGDYLAGKNPETISVRVNDVDTNLKAEENGKKFVEDLEDMPF